MHTLRINKKIQLDFNEEELEFLQEAIKTQANILEQYITQKFPHIEMEIEIRLTVDYKCGIKNTH